MEARQGFSQWKGKIMAVQRTTGETTTSAIKPRILATAVAMFADYGYFGVTTRDLARKADVTEGSIYHIFENKENLFDSALRAVVKRPLDPAKFLLMYFENRKKQDFCAAIAQPVRKWYFSFSPQSGRLMAQAGLCKNERWRQIAYAPLEKIIEILA